MAYMADFWLAPHPTGPLRWEQRVPGSKSMTNRALVLAALADAPSVITQALIARDTELMIAALRELGAEIEVQDATTGPKIHVAPGQLRGGHIDCGLAGTLMRFLPPVAALAGEPVAFDGDEQARVRPMGAILGALRDLDVTVDAEGDSLPFSISASNTPAGGEVTIDASQSSQFVSGLLLAAPRFEKGITVHHVGGAIPSRPHIEMTLAMLREAGVTVDEDGDSWTVHPGPINGREWSIEPDLSNATPFLAGAAVAGGRVTVHDWPAVTTQAGDLIRDVLFRMSVTIEQAHGQVTVVGSPGARLRGIDYDMSALGELTPTVAALCALADSPSRLTGIAHLRGHETDRLSALATELNGLGGNVRELPDGLEITPAPLHAGRWHTYADHRMATAGAILGLAVEGIEVEDIATTAKTLPGFAELWETMVSEGSAHA